MRIRRLTIQNFRGIENGIIDFSDHTLLVGGNNVGKSTVCEALDLLLGPERLYRRPIVNEHDFFNGKYLNSLKEPVEIRLEAILTELGEEFERRFRFHLCRWNEEKGEFVQDVELTDEEETKWALPIMFVGRYDRNDDDFDGYTFFSHPENAEDEDRIDQSKIAPGRRPFRRDHKRECGFIYLRAYRTGSRALSFQKGSLLDTILKIGADEKAELWEDTLSRLSGFTPSIGDIPQLKNIRRELRERMARFVALGSEEDATAFFASELTRQHLREVIRLFVNTEPSNHLIPFMHLGTGSINLLVFALLTFIADLKGKRSVIFAMEEPEIALPPYIQRRVTQFVIQEMGQAIVTSHSPYVFELFDPQQVVVLNRSEGGKLVGKSVNLDDARLKSKTFRIQRRQFAETLLGRAVLVVEGSTEAAIIGVASSVLEQSLGPTTYSHIDFTGITIFNAGGDGAVPKFGPVFKALGKIAFAFYDKLNTPFTQEAQNQLADYESHWESKYYGIESLLVEEMPIDTIHRFLAIAENRADYPRNIENVTKNMNDSKIRKITLDVLSQRKGDAYGYAAILIEQASSAEELPKTIRDILMAINDKMSMNFDLHQNTTDGDSYETEDKQNGTLIERG